ncbi:hypothetical protein N431DRAFT_489926 [Stipitochalara longipes BDJ]|nr:hypothetical protein N431DRAFT_489926 [Stipitochalara longipes BDJ]
MNGQSTRLDQPRLHEEQATMTCYDQQDPLTSMGGPLLEISNGSLQIAAERSVRSGDKGMDSLNLGMKDTVAPILNNRESNFAISEVFEESPVLNQGTRHRETLKEAISPKNTVLNVFDPIPSPRYMHDSWEYPPWFHDPLLLQDGDWNFEESYIGDNHSSGVTEGDNIVQSKDLEAETGHKRIVRFPCLPIHSCEASRSILQQEHFTGSEKIIDKYYESYGIQSTWIYGVGSQKTSNFFADNIEPFAQGPISLFSPVRDRDEGRIPGSIWEPSSSRAMYSTDVHLEVAVDDEDEIEEQVDDDLTQKLTSLVEKTGLMYI